MYCAYTHIPLTYSTIMLKKKELLIFSKIDEYDIQNFWIRNGEVRLDGFHDVEYDGAMPLYLKMIFRFWQYNKSAVMIAKTIDPIQKGNFLYKYNITDDLIEFFSWIKNYLMATDVGAIYASRGDDLVKRWKDNEIQFFFFLTVDARQLLVDRYNSDMEESCKRLRTVMADVENSKSR